MSRVAIVDYGTGNLNSVLRKFRRIGAEPVVVSDPADLSQAEKLVLPGVGHFGRAMRNLHESGMKGPLVRGIPAGSEFYFVHAYHMVCADPADVLGETFYAYPFASAVERQNIFGVQFHPEKSHDVGEALLKNFVEL